jgi:UPF0755 protein
VNNFQLIRILRSGRQTPVKLTFNNIRTKEQLAGRLSTQLMADSASILAVLNDTALLAKDSLNPNTSIALFIPNTYEVFWDMDAMELYNRMKKEYNSFWTNERKAKAAAIPLTPVQVSTLASIVEEETNGKSDEWRSNERGTWQSQWPAWQPASADARKIKSTKTPGVFPAFFHALWQGFSQLGGI